MAKKSIPNTSPTVGRIQTDARIDHIEHGFEDILDVVREIHASNGTIVGGLQFDSDPLDRLSARIDMAHAMILQISTCEGREHFQAYNEQIQESYYWAIQETLDSAKLDLQVYTRSFRKKRAQASETSGAVA